MNVPKAKKNPGIRRCKNPIISHTNSRAMRLKKRGKTKDHIFSIAAKRARKDVTLRGDVLKGIQSNLVTTSKKVSNINTPIPSTVAKPFLSIAAKRARMDVIFRVVNDVYDAQQNNVG